MTAPDSDAAQQAAAASRALIEQPHLLTSRVALTHALAQYLADSHGIDVLHVKGPALDRELNGGYPRNSTDVDLLVRPSQVTEFIDLLREYGWSERSTFAAGSAFEHAANWHHPDWGYIDLHRKWPGPRIDDESAFNILFARRTAKLIAHWPCTVPDRTGQALIMVLHAARTGGPRSADVENSWSSHSDEHRAAVAALAHELQADTALVVGTGGELSSVAKNPDYLLWSTYAEGAGNRLDDWLGRWRAQPTLAGKAQVVVRAALPNSAYLEWELGRPPTRAEVVQAQWRRVRSLARSAGSRLRTDRRRS